MRTIKQNIYKFSELSDEAKQKVLENLYGINVDYEWWESIDEDAETVGIKITDFDIGRNNYINATIDNCHNTARGIIENHGETCETYKAAEQFLENCKKLEDVEDEDYYLHEEELAEYEEEFEKELLEEYLSILKREYEYNLSEEAIIETITANEYEFYENGKLH